jgi:hypothetical protein
MSCEARAIAILGKIAGRKSIRKLLVGNALVEIMLGVEQ